MKSHCPCCHGHSSCRYFKNATGYFNNLLVIRLGPAFTLVSLVGQTLTAKSDKGLYITPFKRVPMPCDFCFQISESHIALDQIKEGNKMKIMTLGVGIVI
jgi:hypothetical protein